MKKNLITLAVAATLASPLAVQAEDSASVSGFVDIIYTNVGDGGAGSNAFGADGEIDVQATKGDVTVRADVDLRLDGTSGQLEQAFFAWKAMDAVTVIGGVFNNPIGQELEDAPDMEFTSHSAVWNILDGQTVLNGNNIAGVAVAGGNEMFTGTLAVVNDIGGATDNDNSSKNSIAAVLNVNPMDSLALELGYVTQDTSAENVLDFNAQYGIAGFTLGLDVLMADKIVDTAYNVWGSFAINDKAAVKARYEAVDLEASGADTASKYTLYGTYSVEDNLSVALEYSQGDLGNNATSVAGIIDDSTVTLEFIGTF
ncbi:MAG TPA: porin [Gammaproteobacteria bacterium]|nr:porin [Gammaproteobacteria bacterium]